MSASRSGNLFWDILTFDRLMTGPIVHLIYWCGLGLIALGGFGVVGMTVGVAIRSGTIEGMLLAIPLLIAFSRMYVVAHHLSDVVCAALLATLVAYWVARRAVRPPETQERFYLSS